MSGQDVEREILIPMQRLFRPPREYATETDAAAALRDYVDGLKDFAIDDLKAGWVTVRDGTKGRTWPMPGVFVDACAKARYDRETLSGTRQDKHKHGGGGRRDGAEAWKAWVAAKGTAMAREAAQSGVAWAFKCAVLSGFDPKNIDIDRLVRQKQSADALELRIRAGKSIISPDGRDLGPMPPKAAETALSMYASITLSEAQTQQELGFAGGNYSPGPDIENLVM